MWKLDIQFSPSGYLLGREALSHRFPYRLGEWYDASRSRTQGATDSHLAVIWLNGSPDTQQIVFLALGRDAGLIESYAALSEAVQKENGEQK